MSEEDMLESVKKDFSDQLLLGMDIHTVRDALRAMIEESKDPSQSNVVRAFCKKYIIVSGQPKDVTYSQISNFLRNKPGITETVMHALLELIEKCWNKQVIIVPIAGTQQKKLKVSTSDARIVRKLIDHSITIINSLRATLDIVQVSPEDVLDGDRMQIQGAIKSMCDRFGLRVAFSDSFEGVPVSSADLRLKKGRQ